MARAATAKPGADEHAATGPRISYRSAGATATARRSQATAILGAALLLGALFVQGVRPIFDTDEGRYTAVALQMMQSGDWLVPRLSEHELHLTKPPMTYWALAVSMSTLGIDEWAARLPNVLAFVLTGLALARVGRRYCPRQPVLPALIWATSLVPTLAASWVNADSLLVLFESLAMLAWIEMVDAHGRAQHHWRAAMWAAFGLAFLTKGPPGLIPLLPIVATTLYVGRWRWAALRDLASAGSIALFALLGLGWFVYLVISGHADLSYFLGYEFVDRIVTDVHDRHGEWYGAIEVYVPVLTLAALPWLATGAVSWKSIARLRHVEYWRRSRREDPLHLAIVLWFLLPLVVFALARSRLYLYVLPLCVPMSLLLARAVDARLDLRQWRWRAGIAAWIVVVLGVKAAISIFPHPRDAQAGAAQLRAIAPAANALLFVDGQPAYGLRFYTGLPVERVVRPGASTTIPGKTLRNVCDALRSDADAVVISADEWLANKPRAPPECEGIALTAKGRGVWVVASGDR